MSGFIVYVCYGFGYDGVHTSSMLRTPSMCFTTTYHMFHILCFRQYLWFFPSPSADDVFLAQCSSCTMYFYENFYLTIADRGIYMYGCFSIQNLLYNRTSSVYMKLGIDSSRSVYIAPEAVMMPSWMHSLSTTQNRI